MGRAARAKKKKRMQQQLEGAGAKVTAEKPQVKRETIKTKKEEELNFFARAVKFLKEVKIEAKKITWANKKQVMASTLMVLVFSLFIGAYLGLLDVIYNAIISLLVR
ncbi:MAG: preprotein translocase subunit SecE [Thermodesulfobacteria bacterium]|nr:preprotein translocase subunit SecE [Thermodesulfobacteriota bacterium]